MTNLYQKASWVSFVDNLTYFSFYFLSTWSYLKNVWNTEIESNILQTGYDDAKRADKWCASFNGRFSKKTLNVSSFPMEILEVV